ncbi:MAG TPA: ion channel [Methanobacterium sp.]
MRVLTQRTGILRQSIILFLILLDSILLFLSVISNLRIGTLEALGIFDLLVVLILSVVFIWMMNRSGSKLEYIKKNWTDFIALIPLYFILFDLIGLDSTSILIRLIILIKIFALYLFVRRVSREAIKFQEQTRLVYALAIFLVVFFVCSFIFYLAEHGVNPEVATYEDSIWFVLQTITTVGYGDIIPITGVGRLMGVISMFSALALTSIITSAATFSLIQKFRKGTEQVAEKTRKSVEILSEKLDNMNTRLDELDELKKIDELKKQNDEMKAEIESLKEVIEDKK